VVSNANGGVRQGASTITQQYVKNLAIAEADGDPDKLAEATAPTMARKLREFRQALEVERKYTKDEILERYLNVTYFGAGAYGVEAAARRYFSTTADALTLPQAAMIAGLAKSPTAHAPTADPEAAKERRNMVLTRMVSAGMIDRAEADRVAAQPLNLDLKPAPYGCQDSPFPFFCDYVVAELRNSPSLGRTPEERIDRLLSGGLQIRTTLDLQAQRAAQKAVVDHIAKKHKIGTAIAMVEPGTGAVKAIALNRSWGDGDGATQLNYATDKNQGGSSGFQGGSTFKPFVLAVALRKGIKPSKTFDAPSYISVPGFDKCDPNEFEDPQFAPYGVGNYENESFGTIDMKTATARSVNTYFLQLEKETGVCKPPKLAEKMGLRRADGRPLDRYPSFVLGAQEVSPLRMAEAYATLAADGMHCPTYGVREVKTLQGERIGPAVPSCERVMSREVARDVTKLLRGVIMGGIENRTGAKMDIGRPAAGKTGTTNGARAVWFVGYTPDMAAAVWAGYPARSKKLKDVTIKGRHYETLYGGALPGPIWKQAMTAAHEGKPKRELLP
jgi:membrane peptidoglycan carboxypeptidase